MKSNRYIQSLIQNRLGISFMIAASLLVASGQLCWKVAPAPISFPIVAGGLFVFLEENLLKEKTLACQQLGLEYFCLYSKKNKEPVL